MELVPPSISAPPGAYEPSEVVLPAQAGVAVPQAATRTDRASWEFDPELAAKTWPRAGLASLDGLGVEAADRAAWVPRRAAALRKS